MLKRKILVVEFLGAVDGYRSRSVAVKEIASLDDEIFDLYIYSRPLIYFVLLYFLIYAVFNDPLKSNVAGMTE